jgi:hypothetical protein
MTGSWILKRPTYNKSLLSLSEQNCDASTKNTNEELQVPLNHIRNFKPEVARCMSQDVYLTQYRYCKKTTWTTLNAMRIHRLAVEVECRNERRDGRSQSEGSPTYASLCCVPWIRGLFLNDTHPTKPFNPLKTSARERVRKDAIRVEEKRKHLGESEGVLYLKGKRASC